MSGPSLQNIYTKNVSKVYDILLYSSSSVMWGTEKRPNKTNHVHRWTKQIAAAVQGRPSPATYGSKRTKTSYEVGTKAPVGDKEAYVVHII